MGFVVTRLQVRGFRNYQEFTLEVDPSLTILVGPNAAGKTNLVEAVQLLTAADSFRRPQWADLIARGSSEARLDLDAVDGERVYQVELTVSSAGRRTYRVNGKVRRTLSDVAGTIPCVIFTPDDLALVKGSAEKRRSGVDSVGDQLSPAYAAVRLEYERVVRQRNALLKETPPEEDQLSVWTERLISLGASFGAHRARLFARIKETAEEAFHALAPGEQLEVVYVSSAEEHGTEDASVRKEKLHAALQTRSREERARGVSLVGPHRDEIVFLVDGADARAFASQGQQRTIALAWKLAEFAVISQIAGHPPILLLDDVMSELDRERRHALATLVGEAAQTIVTTTNLHYFEEELVEQARIVRLGA